MKRIKEQVVRISSLNLTNAYFNETPTKRKKMCKAIIHQAFKQMAVKASIDKKSETMSNLLDRSIGVHEEEEKYEDCKILLDVKNVIPDVALELKSTQD